MINNNIVMILLIIRVIPIIYKFILILETHLQEKSSILHFKRIHSNRTYIKLLYTTDLPII